MNPDKKPDYKKLYEIVKEKYQKTSLFSHGPFDETYYTLRVYEISKKIIKKLGKGNKEIILTAAILHDIGKIKLQASKIIPSGLKSDAARQEWRRHAKLGVPLAAKILRKMGHSEDFIKKVCYLIEFHDSRKMEKKSLDLEIIQDADFVADFGFAGFIRAFLYGTRFKQLVINSIKYIQKSDKELRYDKLNLEVSRKMAREKIKLQERLAEGIAIDLKSDLL